MKKKYYIALPVVIIFSVIALVALLGFVWETIDMGRVSIFALITSVILPCIIEILLVVLYCQYLTIDEQGVTKYLFGKKIKHFDWDEIKEIRLDLGHVYISKEELSGEKKAWNKKNLIFVMFSDKVASAIKTNAPQKIRSNLN